MAGKGTGKSGYGHKATGPKLPPVHKPHGPTGGGRAGNVKQPAKSSGGEQGGLSRL